MVQSSMHGYKGLVEIHKVRVVNESVGYIIVQEVLWALVCFKMDMEYENKHTYGLMMVTCVARLGASTRITFTFLTILENIFTSQLGGEN